MVSEFDRLKISGFATYWGCGFPKPGFVFPLLVALAASARLLDEHLKLLTDMVPSFQKLLTLLLDSSECGTTVLPLLLLLLLRHVGPVYTRALLCPDNDEPRAIALYNITMHYIGLAAHVHIIG